MEPPGEVLVVIPAYREAARIGGVVRGVLAFMPAVLVVDDGSDDGTADAARAVGAEVLRLEANQGKGTALARGFDHARARGFRAVVAMDADGQHRPEDLPAMLAAWRASDAAVLVGNRMGDVRDMPPVRRLTNRFMSWLLSRRMGQRVPDTQCGYRLYRLDALEGVTVESPRFAAESEILLRLAARGCRIGSVPVATVYGGEQSKIRPVRDTLRFMAMMRRFRGADFQPPAGPSGPAGLLARSAVGGALMGLANLVPGISGGTMLLASGVYPKFIEAVAGLSTLRIRRAGLAVLAAVGLPAAAAILLLAGPVKDLVVHHRWVMYSLFVGLTLGGAPVVWRMVRPATAATWIAAAAGLAGMGLLAVLQQRGAAAGAAGGTPHAMLFFAGLAGAGAMILPGVSGGYLLLLMGQYEPILAAIDRFKDALQAGDFGAAFDVGLHVGLPVGLGVAAGLIAVSNLLRWLLRRFAKATLGALLGLLVGAVVGLWPFQAGVRPAPGAVVKGRVLTAADVAALAPEDYPTVFFPPTPAQAAGALGLIALGFLCTVGLSRFGGESSGRARPA